MSPSCGLLHSWGFVFIWPGSAARPENPQTAGCCSCAPSVLRGPSSFADTLLLRGYPRMDNQPTDSAQNRQLVPFFRHAAFADMRHSGLRSQRFYPLRVSANRRQPPERAGPLPRRQEGPGWGYPQPGRKFSLLWNQEQEIFPFLLQVRANVIGIVFVPFVSVALNVTVPPPAIK